MYHAPVSADLPEEEVPPAEIPEADVGSDAAAARLREADVQNGQAAVSALFAPYFALAGAGSALLAGWAMYGHSNLALIIGWLAAVAGGHWFTYQRAMDLALAAGSRSADKRPDWIPITEALALAVVWCSLPVYTFGTLSPDAQVVMGGAMGAMVIAAVALSAIPAAAMAWIGAMTLSLCVAYYLGSPVHDPKIGVTILAAAAIAVSGIARLTRWTYSQLLAIAKVRSQAESVRLLLREYEHRGVG